MRKESYLTYSLIGINVLVAIIGIFADMRNHYGMGFSNLIMGSNSAVTYKFGLIPSFVSRGEYYRLLTSMFIHGGLIHLLSNMYALYFYGKFIESSFGWLKMLIIYMFSGLCGGLLVMVFSNANTVTVGASGAIFGLLSASYLLARKVRMVAFTKSIGSTILINLFITFSNPSISIGGHVGGLIGGAIITFLLFFIK